VVINGVTASATISLATATSPSNAAQLIQNSLNIQGPSVGSYQGSIAGTTLTVSAVNNGAQTASFVGSISGTTLTVSAVNSGTIAVGNLLQGSGVTPGTTITALGSALCGGIGTYTVSNSQTVSAETLSTYAAGGSLQVGSVLTGTGVSAGTYVAAFLTGAGGAGTYTVSSTQTAAAQAITATAPAVVYDSISGGIEIFSSTFGTASTIAFATGALAVSLNLTQQTGATISQGAAQSTPAGAMNAVLAVTKNFAQFMTTFEPCVPDKEAFSNWTNGQNNRYHYAQWTTNVLATSPAGPPPEWANITSNNYSGTSLIYDSGTVDTVGGEVAAFVMGYGASINFNVPQGRATAAFKSQSGLAPQIFSTAQRAQVVAFGGNCYVDATTSNQAFNFYDNGSVSGPFLWLDSYLDQIWLNSALQAAFMNLLTTVNSIPYNQQGYAMIAEAASTPIAAAVVAGVIQPGIPLSGSQIANITAATGNPQVPGIISTIGWYLSIVPASPATRAARQSPGISLYFSDGGSIQQINLASIDVQ
jgi:hypothetical protein